MIGWKPFFFNVLAVAIPETPAPITAIRAPFSSNMATLLHFVSLKRNQVSILIGYLIFNELHCKDKSASRHPSTGAYSRSLGEGLCLHLFSKPVQRSSHQTKQGEQDTADCKQ